MTVLYRNNFNIGFELLNINGLYIARPCGERLMAPIHWDKMPDWTRLEYIIQCTIHGYSDYERPLLVAEPNGDVYYDGRDIDKVKIYQQNRGSSVFFHWEEADLWTRSFVVYCGTYHKFGRELLKEGPKLDTLIKINFVKVADRQYPDGRQKQPRKPIMDMMTRAWSFEKWADIVGGDYILSEGQANYLLSVFNKKHSDLKS